MIRLLDEKDIDAVMDIWLKTNITAHNFIPEKYWIGNFHAIKGEYLPTSENYIFIENNDVKAFISIIEGHFIGALFVAKEYQARGIGQKLINHCKDLYKNLDVAVYEENKKALAFYEKCDFGISRKQKNSDSGHPEYIMNWHR